MKRIIIFLSVSLVSLCLWSQSFTLVSWNIQDLGRTKSEAELDEMAQILRDYDLVAIQEVVAKDPAGAQAVAKLADRLNRMGAKWDYAISDPTQSPSSYISERYAYLWKTSRLRAINRPRLDTKLAQQCDREPYLGYFEVKKSGQRFHLVNFHARRYDQQPELEIQHFTAYLDRFEGSAFIIMGDFNLDEAHPVWEPFYQRGFNAALFQMPTTLKRKCNRQGEYFNYAIDNIYFPTQYFQKQNSGRIDIAGGCDQVEAARSLSDHVPVFLELTPL